MLFLGLWPRREGTWGSSLWSVSLVTVENFPLKATTWKNTSRSRLPSRSPTPNRKWSRSPWRSPTRRSRRPSWRRLPLRTRKRALHLLPQHRRTCGWVGRPPGVGVLPSSVKGVSSHGTALQQAHPEQTLPPLDFLPPFAFLFFSPSSSITLSPSSPLLPFPGQFRADLM